MIGAVTNSKESVGRKVEVPGRGTHGFFFSPTHGVGAGRGSGSARRGAAATRDKPVSVGRSVGSEESR
jgi:hypothetical protein